jgi:hypothetical protein
VAELIEAGKDMIPRITTLRALPRPRLVWETEEGEVLRHRITALEKLIIAYDEGVIAEK